MSTTISGGLTESNYEVLDKIKDDAENNKLIKNQTLDQEAFLKLLTTQLSTQDPMEPMSDAEFMGQMAQFSTLESTNSLVDLTTKNVSQTDSLVTEVQLLNSNITDLVAQMASDSTNSNTEILDSQSELMDTNTSILNELIKLNKTIEAYGINDNTN